MRGQCYDGASNMAGSKSGCSTIIKEHAPLAVFHHCAAHRLNLSIVSACKIMAFKNTESYIGEMARFFQYSPKRQRLLDAVIKSLCPEAHATKLKDTCKTRWVQHIDSYATFMELLPAVHVTLLAMASPSDFEQFGSDWNWDGDTLVKVNGFIHQLESSSFLLAFKILLECLTYLRGITIKLQMQAIDVLYAYGEVTNVISLLKRLRENATSTFSKIFKETLELGKSLHGADYELQKPRTNARQVHRSNVDAARAEDYFRITLYNEFLSHIISDLEERFTATSTSIGLLKLLPNECVKIDSSELPEPLSQAVKFYQGDLPLPVMLPIEFRMWVAKWKDSESRPEKLVDTLKSCDVSSFPNIHVLLRLALTLPITSCECERSFSQLKLIKTSRRSTTSSIRLSGLALMKINRKICSDMMNSPHELNELVMKFSQIHTRRMKLPFVL